MYKHLIYLPHEHYWEELTMPTQNHYKSTLLHRFPSEGPLCSYRNQEKSCFKFYIRTTNVHKFKIEENDN